MRYSRFLFGVSLAAILSLTAVGPVSGASIGFVSFDPGALPNSGTFDITNETGANASTFPDTTFPVVTPVTLSQIVLTVNFLGGGTITETEQSGNFLSDGSGGFLGQFNFDLTTFPIASAVLEGDLSPGSLTLNNGAMGR